MKMISWQEDGEYIGQVTCAAGIHVREGVDFSLSVEADDNVAISMCVGDSDDVYSFDQGILARDLLTGLAVDLASFFQDDVETVAEATDYMLEQLLAQEGSVEVKWLYESGDRVEPAGVDVYFSYDHGSVKFREKVTIDLERADELFHLDHSEAD